MDDEITMDVLPLILNAEEIDPEIYSIGQYADEALCIEKIGDEWYVYGADHGRKYGLMKFSSETEACSIFLERIKDYID